MWNLSGPGIEPVSPALAGRFLTSGPPAKSSIFNFTAQDLEKYGSTTAGTHIRIFESSNLKVRM